VHYLSSPCTLSSLVVHSLSRLCTSIHPLRLFSAFIPCVHHVHLDPSIAPLYLLRYSTADPLNSLVDIQGKPPIVHVGHYGQPTVTSPVYYDTKNTNQNTGGGIPRRNYRTLCHHTRRSRHYPRNRLATCTQPRSKLGSTTNSADKMPKNMLLITTTSSNHVKENTNQGHYDQCYPGRRRIIPGPRYNIWTGSNGKLPVYSQFCEIR
jgi:hypothetical protein